MPAPLPCRVRRYVPPVARWSPSAAFWFICPGVADAYEVGSELYIGGDPAGLVAKLEAWTSQDPAPLRLFLGHAGWAPGQLQAEIDRGTWIVAPGHPALVLANEPDADFWETRVRVGSGFPPPSLN